MAESPSGAVAAPQTVPRGTLAKLGRDGGQLLPTAALVTRPCSQMPAPPHSLQTLAHAVVLTDGAPGAIATAPLAHRRTSATAVPRGTLAKLGRDGGQLLPTAALYRTRPCSQIMADAGAVAFLTDALTDGARRHCHRTATALPRCHPVTQCHRCCGTAAPQCHVTPHVARSQKLGRDGGQLFFVFPKIAGVPRCFTIILRACHARVA